jgi:dTDP-4-dehydrorhamnose 3,5-epimerase
MSAHLSPYKIPGLLLVEGKAFPDERGLFMESWREEDFAAVPGARFVQDNLSKSRQGVIRGLHYQKRPSGIGKLVRCVYGKIWDVAVDIRKGSPTFGQWAALELSGDINRMLWVPEGFAHGFCALSLEAAVLYRTTGYWSPENERGIIWNDPALNIPWPVEYPHLSSKDAELPALSQADNNFVYIS